jgi:hypothetical protein
MLKAHFRGLGGVEVARENHRAARFLSKRKPYQLSILHH